LALHNYHDANGGFPKTPYSPSPGVQHSWVPQVFPYVEETALYAQYQFNVDWTDAANAQAIAATPRVLQCPTAGINRRNGNRGVCDYVVVTGFQSPNPFINPFPSSDSSVLTGSENRRLEAITDGTSNTMLVTEDAGRPDRYTMGALNGPCPNGGAWANTGGPRITAFGWNPATNSSPGTCAVNCDNYNEVYSLHTGGVNTAFADGSVRFLSQTININVLVALFTRNGGEVLPIDVFN
jgi:prepilin-type processing-associated H-X9-DG protein